MKLSKWSGFFSIALLAALVGCGSKGIQKVAAQAPPATVEITEAAQSDADIYVEYPGQTYARNMVDVRGRVGGYIEKWLFRPGQEVTAGQPLYILDLRPFLAQVEQAQGTLHQTEADLSFAQHQVSLRQAEANLAASQSNLVKAQQDYERLKPLVEQDAAAKQDLDAAVAALRSAEASVRANQANVEQTRLTTDTQVQSTEGKVQAQRGTLETATLNVQYGTIRAPISGLIGDTQVPVGGLVNPNATPIGRQGAGTARHAGDRHAQRSVRHHPSTYQRPDRRYASAGGRTGQSERHTAAHHHRAAGPDLGAIQGQRSAISGLHGQEGWAGEGRAGDPTAAGR